MDTLEWLNLTPKLSDVDTWTKFWSVHDDPFPHIRCRSCGGRQSIQDSAKRFTHTPGCRIKSFVGFSPWIDLRWIFEQANA